MGPGIDNMPDSGSTAPQEAAAAGDPAAEQQGAFKQHWLALTFAGRCGMWARPGRWGRGRGAHMT